jgi:hypothetical protein
MYLTLAVVAAEMLDHLELEELEELVEVELEGHLLYHLVQEPMAQIYLVAVVELQVVHHCLVEMVVPVSSSLLTQQHKYSSISTI